MSREGLITAWQAEHLSADAVARGVDELWANPYYRAVSDHTRAVIEQLLKQLALS